MIREELLHPALSHFPIAFLVAALIGNVLNLFFKNSKLSFMNEMLLYSGSLLILPTLFLGDMALDIVKYDLCRLTLASNHEELGELTLILAIVSSSIQIAQRFKPHIAFKSALILALLVTNFNLVQTAHNGAKLVYEDGAGVIRPLGDCPKKNQ